MDLLKKGKHYSVTERITMKYTVLSNGIHLFEPDLDLASTLDCGQAFRWEETKPSTFSGFFLDHPLTVSQNGQEFIFHDISEKDFLEIWVDYFDLNTDYSSLKNEYSKDEIMKLACEFASGIRLLRQDSWEALISFIFSQNNNIKRIKGIIKRLCEHFGGFPSAETLCRCEIEDLEFLRAGFRTKYVLDAAQKVASGEIKLDEIRLMPYEDAKYALMAVKGVGPKVADCVLLYGMYRTEAFPRDVWIKRAEAEYYPDGMPECIEKTKGIAQQFLFHYIRNR